MSEQNILNPTATSLLNFDYGYAEAIQETRSIWQAQSGKPFSRPQMARGRIFDLPWGGRDVATKNALQQWEQQYKNDFFTLADWERGRYFSGRFDGPLTFSPAGNNKYNIRGRFIELPGLALFANPNNWARDAVFLPIRNGFGEDLVKLGGSGWFFELNGGGLTSDYASNVTNDVGEWLYFGYGFRFWSRKQNNLGKVEVSCTRVRDGFAMLAPPPVIDLYNASSLVSAQVFDSLSMFGFPLDLYRVKARVTGTKNASSSDFFCYVNVIEVMQ